MKSMLQKLPIGTSTLEQIVNNNCLYVDKTMFVEYLANNGRYYFLSRPRRFGKSLMLDTIKQAFLAKKELFKGLYLENHWDWSKQYPIIHISFGSNQLYTANYTLADKLNSLLSINAANYDMELRGNSYSDNLLFLIHDLYNKYNQQVVILIDEYDKPILDVIEDLERATLTRDILRGFYGVIKDCDQYLRLVFLTGVTRFSKVGIFSGLNNLADISMLNDFSTICGVTQEELETYCKHYIERLATTNNLDYATCLTKIKDWYNGFCFSRQGTKVYNPYSTMLLLNNKEFSNYWFSSGSASFVIKLMKQQADLEMFELEGFALDVHYFDTFEIDNLNVFAILFQAGYLTIKSYDIDSDTYILGYPNKEVAKSFKENIFDMFSKSQIANNNNLLALYRAFNNNDIPETIEILKEIFLNIDYDIKISHEKHYQNIFYLIFQLLGYRINVEYKTSRGRIDAIIQTKTNIYIFEFKIDKTAMDALAQIKAKAYYERFLALGKPIHLIGVNFSSELRNIDDFVCEMV